jgi:hypothetical protein
MGFDAPHQRYRFQDLFVRTFTGFDGGKRSLSDFSPTGVLPSFLPQLAEHGVSLPDPVLERARAKSEGSRPNGGI